MDFIERPRAMLMIGPGEYRARIEELDLSNRRLLLRVTGEGMARVSVWALAADRGCQVGDQVHVEVFDRPREIARGVRSFSKITRV